MHQGRFELPATKPPTEPKASWVITVGLIGFIVAALAIFLVVRHYDPTWDVEQWGPVAAWFSGLATFVAVSISLYQTRLAQQSAGDANRRLNEQLDSQRRAVEIQVLTSIIKAYEVQSTHADRLLRAMQRRHKNRQIASGGDEAVSVPYDRYLDEKINVDRATVEAVLLIVDGDTRSAIGNLEITFKTLDSLLQEMYTHVLSNRRFSPGSDIQASEYLVGLRSLLGQVIEVGRIKVARLPPLNPDPLEHD